MYKHLFRVVLWMIGVIGLMTWITLAEYSQVINITWFDVDTPNQLIQSFTQKRDDLELYFVSSTWSISHYTIMDRNMWATEVYNQDYNEPNTWSFWYYYQWWNNYWFESCYLSGCSSFPWWEGVSTTQVERVVWDIWPSKFARNVFYERACENCEDWKSRMNGASTGDNIWWWEWDTTQQNWAWTKLDRQWPCPNGYHIPSVKDLYSIKDSYWYASRWNDDKVKISSSLLFPPASARTMHGKVWSSTWGWWRSSSSSNDDNYNAYYFWNTVWLRYGIRTNRGLSISVRCLKNVSNDLWINIHINWWKEAVVTFTGNLSEWKITYISNPTRVNSTFLWWYSDEDFTNRIEKWDIVPSDLYAKWWCNNGYKENEINTECIAKIYTITYILYWWINSDSNTWFYTIDTPTIILQDATREWYIFDWWFYDPEFTTKVVEISKWNVWNKTLYARWKCKEWYIENEEKTACEKNKVEFDANWWKFENNELIFKKEISIIQASGLIREVLYTPNLTDEWEYKWRQSGENPWNNCAPASWSSISGRIEVYARLAGFVQIEWSESLNVSIKYGWSSYGAACVGPIWVWTWEHRDYDPRDPNHSSSAITYLSEFPAYGTYGVDEFVVQWDSITIIQANWCPNYWWYLTVSGTWTVEIAEYPDDAFDNIPEPSREWHKFVWWYLSGDTEFDTWSVSTWEVTYVHAKWECAQWYVDKQWQCVKEETKPSWGSSWWWWGWWWGGSSSSCKNLPTNAVANNSSKPSSNTNYYYSTNTSKVCTFQCKSGYTRNEEKETCDKASDSQTTTWTNIKEPEVSTWNNTKVETWNNTEVQTWNNAEIQTWNVTEPSEQVSQNDEQKTEDSPAKTSESKSNSTTSSTYSTEFQQAYEFAHEKWITTMPTIEKANMNWPLTRIAMAKMLSQYAMNVLWQKPANIVTPKFNDVTDKMDTDYDDGVTLAYQLWIMWQNMPNNNFRPNDEVTRAEFATALSRMAYWTSDWEYKWTWKYYIHHLKKLKEEWIITKDDPKMKELRGYVMIMLMRSAK